MKIGRPLPASGCANCSKTVARLSPIRVARRLPAEHRRLKDCSSVMRPMKRSTPRLMRALCSEGNRHRALKQYQQCAEILQRELETEPDPATTELHREIESGSFQPLSTASREPVHQKREQSAIESIAILPLTNLSADANMEYLSDGIAENIINRLAQLPALRVMAWGTVARYKGSEFLPGEVGRDLGLGVGVIIGRVLQLGEHWW